jgi:hypothetical protein
LGNRESKTAAPAIPGPAAVDTVKALEDQLKLIGRDPGAGVSDLDLELAVAGVGTHQDLVVGVGVRHGVANEVPEHLSEAVGVALKGSSHRLEPELALAEQGEVAPDVFEELVEPDRPSSGARRALVPCSAIRAE